MTCVELLRYRQLVLCPDSGHMKYQTKLHEGLVPRQLHDVGKVIQVRNEEVFVYVIHLLNEAQLQMIKQRNKESVVVDFCRLDIYDK